MYEMAEVHGIIEVYVSHIPQAYLVDFYHKNLCTDESDEEVKQKVRIHVERKKKARLYVVGRGYSLGRRRI